jgi:hypothetical protein
MAHQASLHAAAVGMHCRKSAKLAIDGDACVAARIVAIRHLCRQIRRQAST